MNSWLTMSHNRSQMDYFSYFDNLTRNDKRYPRCNDSKHCLTYNYGWEKNIPLYRSLKRDLVVTINYQSWLKFACIFFSCWNFFWLRHQSKGLEWVCSLFSWSICKPEKLKNAQPGKKIAGKGEIILRTSGIHCDYASPVLMIWKVDVLFNRICTSNSVSNRDISDIDCHSLVRAIETNLDYCPVCDSPMTSFECAGQVSSKGKLTSRRKPTISRSNWVQSQFVSINPFL